MRFRYIIVEEYFGKIDITNQLCCCDSLHDCKDIIESLRITKKGRPFKYKIVVNGDWKDLDPIIQVNSFTGVTTDYSCYFDGVYTL